VANEVLYVAEFSGPITTATNAFHQLAVQLADESQRHRKCRSESVVHRVDVVQDFVRILLSYVRRRANFGEHQLLRCRNRPFDAAGQDRLAMEERQSDEKRIDHPPDRPDEATNRMIGIGQDSHSGMVERKRVRRIRDERGHSGLDLDESARTVLREISSPHDILGTCGISDVILG
jgi:hypothetical protein